MKKKLNPKKFAVVGAAVLIAGMATAGIVAAPRYSTTAITRMNTNDMGIELNAEEHVEKAMPGDEFKYPASVTNTGDYISYLRVRLNKSWYDEEGKMADGDVSYITLMKDGEEIKSGTGSDWIVQVDDNGEDVYFYYRTPVEAKETTTEFMDAYKIADISNSEQDTYAGKKVHIDVDTEEVQVPKTESGAVDTVKAADAIMSEWGLEVNIEASSGVMVSIEEE
ncbi:hypothetical protein MCG98_01875 [Ruminococcus sp. OA3]|uniref:hypothetical protein n=1 Tax=Ruminococcus sp. OA3 TaxID=2914164 RepID=UPI001F069808|nr:hypothetical protein [Ruminococcus sp. OA3]MCH1981324.1 hypothetical protein [Ruminococcus sp. OA3]